MPLTPDSTMRPRMQLACAECRRLKLKCDKNTPCLSCVRRGCASICPQGRMISKGSQFVLANTEQLHDKIDALIGRVRQLENALEASHSHNSCDPHPLLRDELRIIATPIDSAISSEPEPIVKEEELVESMGTLTLDNCGARYFGATGAFADNDGPDGAVYKYDGEASLALAGLPAKIAHMAHAFPVRLPSFDEAHLSTWILENCLPPFPEAWSLFENYWEHYAWHFTPFPRAAFVEQILSPLYHRSPDNGDKPLGHRLALLFMVLPSVVSWRDVFAIGDLMDFTKPLQPASGLRYYLLARASLCLDPVFESPTVTALQATYLMGVFLMMSRGINEPEHAWVMSGNQSQVSTHEHDATKFHLSSEEVENRQYVLVSVVSAEIWQCLSTGRPPSQTFSSFDWAFSKIQSADMEADKSARFWAASFIRDCSEKVLETVVGNKPTSYSSILELDAKIREHPIHEPLSDAVLSTEDHGVSITMQRSFMGLIRVVSLLFLHRRCFALALRDFPDDPLKSPFAPSVMACHHSATHFLTNIIALHDAVPAMALRIWFIWPNIFAATLILGSIVARSPNCSLAPSALSTVRQLKEKAFTAFARNKAPRDHFSTAPGGIQVLDEIHALGGGGPRVISKKSRPTSLPSTSDQKTPSEKSLSPTPEIPSDDYTPSPFAPNIHIAEQPPQTFSPMNLPFDFSSIDFSQFTDFSGGTLPENYNDVYGIMRNSPPSQLPPSGPNVLEEIGLGGECRWDRMPMSTFRRSHAAHMEESNVPGHVSSLASFSYGVSYCSAGGHVLRRTPVGALWQNPNVRDKSRRPPGSVTVSPVISLCDGERTPTPAQYDPLERPIPADADASKSHKQKRKEKKKRTNAITASSAPSSCAPAPNSFHSQPPPPVVPLLTL
ncbi:hypothetical protein K439DRAFT_1618030 [Ramaria rubella]|nr:hypothetical protein K439DRAFT_1618030 [Ramaria rubella]